MKQKKRCYAILYGGRYVGKSFAVSEKKACTNYWWINDKECDWYKNTDMKPSDYDAVEM